MKKLLSLAFLILALAPQLQAQQPATRRSTPPAATKPTPTGRRSTPAPGSLDLPVEAKTSTPVPDRPAAPATPRPRGNWEVYPADHMPRGKNLTEEEAAKLASGDYSEKVLYLVGSFYVAVAEKDRAILQSGEKPDSIRVVAAFPLSIPTPVEGSTMVREEPRGLKIMRIKRASADEVTIYVRDITLR